MISIRMAARAGALAMSLLVAGCEGTMETDHLYRLAVEALGPEAHQGREMVVNPRFLGANHPPLPEGALLSLEEAGVAAMGDVGEEDPQKATLYFTPLDAVGDGRYEVRIFVSFGARPGTLRRGNSWWLVTIECGEECFVVETNPTGPAR